MRSRPFSHRSAEIKSVDETVAGPPLTAVSNSPSPNTVSATSTHTVSFTTADALPSDGKIVVTFPAGFDLTAVGDTDISSGTMDGSFTVVTSGQQLTITRNSGTDQSAAAENIIIADITNTGTAGASYTVTVETQDSSATTINGPTVSSAFSILTTATISSAAHQIFTKDDPLTAISTITITDTAPTATITAANDIRIRIPDIFNMAWDTTDTAATIGGDLLNKVSATVSYDDGKTLVISVTSNFDPGYQFTISGLSFTGFTARSLADNLGLEVYNDGLVTGTDDKFIRITDPDEAAKDLSPVANLEYIPAGSLVIPMDNALQSLVSPFNLMAYGLVNSLLWNEIPVKWAIKTGKAKDGIDFSLEAKQIFPSEILPAAVVLLLGDGSFDPKNNYNWWAVDNSVYLPTYLAFTDYQGETPTDEYFARISGGDAVPDLFIGRLPAADATEAAVMVNKILGYEKTLNTKSWEKNVLLLADNQDPGEEHEYEVVAAVAVGALF